MPRMQRVLFLVFGRIGPRRREMIDSLVRAEPPADSEALKEAIADGTATSNAVDGDADKSQSSGSRGKRGRDNYVAPDDWLSRWDKDKIIAMAKSQIQAGIVNSPRPPMKHADPTRDIPTENIWGKPLHPRLSRSKLQKSYKAVIQRVLPPMGRGEWEMLRDFASGSADRRLWEMPPRRIKIGSDTQPESDWDWEKFADMPARHVERPRSRSLMLLTGAFNDEKLDLGALNRHRFTPRFWRRMYEFTWHLSATMEKKAAGGWDINWGKTPQGPPAAESAHQEFFDGVDELGKIPRATMKTAKGA
jgi:hypothetical protein